MVNKKKIERRHLLGVLVDILPTEKAALTADSGVSFILSHSFEIM